MSTPKEVEEIQDLTAGLGDIIVNFHPVKSKEWDAYEKLVAAHRTLRQIDTDELLQLKLPI